MTMMTGRQAIKKIFQAEGVQYVFGNPGTTELGFIDSLQESPPIQYILALHEGIALGIAHMYANASGKTGVVNLHVAPGLGNAMGSLYNAAMGKVPMVITAGQQDSRMLVREPLLSHDLVAMAKPLTKWAIQVQHVEEIPVILQRAFKVAQDAPRGPVFISLPSNIIEEEADLHLPGPSQTYRHTRPDPEAIHRAAELLSSADRPVIICGDGVAASQAQDELVDLAETIGAQVWDTMLTGSLNFPTSHNQYRGQLPGEYTTIRRTIGEADLVLAVGAELFHEVFYSEGYPLPEGCTLLHLADSSWEIGKNLFPVVGILSDPKPALKELCETVLSKMGEAEKQSADKRRNMMADQKQKERDRQEERARKRWNDVPISIPRLMADLRDCVPSDVVIYNEAITASVDLIRTIPLGGAGSLFGNHGGGIGQGLPGAIGVKLAKPDRPVVAIIGDGSAMYTVQSFWTAAHHKIPVVHMILSNQSYRILKYNLNRYGKTWHISPKGLSHSFMDLTDPPLNFVEMAHGMGMSGKLIIRPEEIQPAVREALDSGAPYVLEVRTEGQVPPP